MSDSDVQPNPVPVEVLPVDDKGQDTVTNGATTAPEQAVVEKDDLATPVESDKPKDGESESKDGEDKPKDDEDKPKDDGDKPKDDEIKAEDSEDKPKDSENKSKDGEDKPKDSENKSKDSEDKSKDSEDKPKNGADAPGPMIKTTAKLNQKDFKKNVKYDASEAPKDDGPDAIRRQVEFYFSDSNLPVDKFMWKITAGKENKPVPLTTLTKFSRMKRFLPHEKIVAALKDSKMVVIDGEAGKETVKRKDAYNTEKRDSVNTKSAYIKGFGDEKPSTQFDLEAWFTKFGTVNSVRLRRTPEKLFKGSVFVEFVDEATLNTFLARDPKPTWEDHELLIMSKTAYVEHKCELIRNGELEPTSKPTFFEGKEKHRQRSGMKHNNDNKQGGRGGRGGRGKFGGGRGNNRGGRGGRGRGGRGGRNDRNGADRGLAVDVAAVDVAAASIKEENKSSSKDKVTAVEPEAKGTKRGREEESGASQPPAKKEKIEAKVKAEVAVEGA